MTSTLTAAPPAAPGRTPSGAPAPHPAPVPAARPHPATAATRPRTPRPRTAPGGPAGTRPRGHTSTHLSTHPRTTVPRPRTTPAPRALPPHTVFAERLLAVLSGERPVHWMLGHTVGEAYEQLVRIAPRTPLRSLGPRPVLRRCSAQAHDGRTVLEAFATIATGPRLRAMAFRLELGADRRWRCAAVELDGLGTADRPA
ncbi:Rv3235 family protein [Streptomyces sp. NPDC092359]|uniref:Rv3235 family protein n=1 Tax=Streptomyces sp. NPDC092359 TaxID=3366014 RepID=UPI003809CBA2